MIQLLQLGLFGVHFALAFTLDLLESLLVLLQQVHLEKIVLFKFLEVPPELLLVEGHPVVVVGVLRVPVDLR